MTNDLSLENISMENAAYLQDIEESSKKEDAPTFEVDSIELATPELFSENDNGDAFNQDTNDVDTQEPKIFENEKSDEKSQTKEPEMFDDSNLEENFEIPAFLRRQKN